MPKRRAMTSPTERASGENLFFAYSPGELQDLLLLLCQSSRSFPTFRSSLAARGKHAERLFSCVGYWIRGGTKSMLRNPRSLSLSLSLGLFSTAARSPPLSGRKNLTPFCCNLNFPFLMMRSWIMMMHEFLCSALMFFATPSGWNMIEKILSGVDQIQRRFCMLSKKRQFSSWWCYKTLNFQ